MTTVEIIILIVGIVVFAGILGYIFTQGKKTETESLTNYTQEEQANIEAAEKLYNKSVDHIEVTEPEFILIKSEASAREELLGGHIKPRPKKKYPRKKKPKVQE